MPPSSLSIGSRFLEAIVPTSMQRRPLISFNVITEMTAEGRKRREPTPDQPMHYVMHAAKYAETGVEVAAGQRPPPAAELETALRGSLAKNGFIAVSKDEHVPELLIILNFGSHGSISDGGMSAPELVPAVRNRRVFIDVLERATLIAGEKFARELKAVLEQEVMRMNIPMNRMPVSPDWGSPYQIYANQTKNRAYRYFAEIAFHPCYFVIASAYDYASAEKGEKRLLWRTKMTVDARGVSMDEVLRPLIAHTGSYLGRETSEAVIVKKQLLRDGKVEVGTATVVEGDVSRPFPYKSPTRDSKRGER